VRNADLELVGRIRSGDGSAFEALYRQHATRLYNLANRMMGSHGEADDLLQDIFLLAYRKLGSFRGESSLGTWLYRLAMNHCLDVLRSRQTRMDQHTDSLDEPDAPPVASPVPLVGSVSRIDLERAIDALPPACRAAFLLHDVEGFGHQEVGGMLGISEGTSKSQVHKARMRIRHYLAHGVKS
jgi:RNA polymerase sigma-70 factor (ECF subfamily)